MMFHVIPKLQSGNERRPTVYLENRPSAREEGDSEDADEDDKRYVDLEDLNGHENNRDNKRYRTARPMSE